MRPLFESSNFGWIGSYCIAVQQQPQIFDPWLFEFAFGNFEEEGFMPHGLKYFSNDLLVSLYVAGGGDKDVIHIDKEFLGIFSQEGAKYSVHCSDEGPWCVT